MTTLSTNAGRVLFTDLEPMDMWESNGVTPDDIHRVEVEARQQERERIAAAVTDLSYWTQGTPPEWATAEEATMYRSNYRAFTTYRDDVLAAIREGNA